MPDEVFGYGSLWWKLTNLTLRSTLPESAGGSPVDSQQDAYKNQAASDAMANPSRTGARLSDTSAKRQVTALHSIPRPMPSANTVAIGKFLCGLRVARKPEPLTMKFTLVDYFVIAATNDTECLSRIFKILEYGEEGYDEVRAEDFIAANDAQNKIVRKKTGMSEQYARDTGAPVHQVMTSKKPQTKVARMSPGALSYKGEDFLNGDSDDRVLSVKHRDPVRLKITSGARASQAAQIRTTGPVSGHGDRSSTRSAFNHKPIVTSSVAPSRKNAFGLVLAPTSYQVSELWTPRRTTFDKETSKCRGYIHKVTKRVYVRGENRHVHRAIYQDQVEIIDKIEVIAEDEEDGWDFMDDMPLTRYL